MAKRARDCCCCGFMGRNKKSGSSLSSCDSHDTVAVFLASQSPVLQFVALCFVLFFWGYYWELSSPKAGTSLLSFRHRATVKIACLDIGHYQTKASICQNQSRTIANCQGNYRVGEGLKWSSRLGTRFRPRLDERSVQLGWLCNLQEISATPPPPPPQLHLQIRDPELSRASVGPERTNCYGS